MRFTIKKIEEIRKSLSTIEDSLVNAYLKVGTKKFFVHKNSLYSDPNFTKITGHFQDGKAILKHKRKTIRVRASKKKNTSISNNGTNNSNMRSNNNSNKSNANNSNTNNSNKSNTNNSNKSNANNSNTGTNNSNKSNANKGSNNSNMGTMETPDPFAMESIDETPVQTPQETPEEIPEESPVETPVEIEDSPVESVDSPVESEQSDSEEDKDQEGSASTVSRNT